MSVNLHETLTRVTSQLISERKRSPGKMKLLLESDIKLILVHISQMFLSEPMLLNISAPIRVHGDIHSQFFDLLRLLELGGYPPNTKYLFLGDYVDRGARGIETIILLFALKLMYPTSMFLLKGNHESEELSKVYGFYDECKKKYNVRLWKNFTDCFNCMPIAALINNKIFACHGGLSPDLNVISQINAIKRPARIPDSGIMCDLLWSDPEKNFKGWGHNDRGVSYVFGEDVVEKFVKDNNIDLICRAHQVVEDGYEFFANKKLITIFSAPNYCSEFTNSAGVLIVDEKLCCTIHVLDPIKKKKV